MTATTFFDIILLVPLLWGIYRGFCKGLIIELASLTGLVLGIYGGVKFSGYASELLAEKFEITSTYLPVISFAITFILIVIAIYLLAKLIESIVNIASLKLLNKLAGAVFGLLKTGLIILILLFILKSVDEKLKLLPEEIKQESFFYKSLDKIPFNDFIMEQFSNPDESVTNLTD